jgi:5,10-methylenetetrahydromethanopterin reductase
MDLGLGVTSGVDAQMLCADIFVSMALAAAHTSRTRLDTGVVIPSNRIAPVTARA